jgi:pimeloyl-ACP methyl ester carboxylesterase
MIIPQSYVRVLLLLTLFAGAYFLLVSSQGETKHESTLSIADDAPLEEIAEQFFLNFVAGNTKGLLQAFRMSDAMRSWIQKGNDKAAVKGIQRQFGGAGELLTKEKIQHDARTQSVELFYSGKVDSLKVRVTFIENQIAGIHYFPWTDERAHGGIPIQLETPTGTIYGTLLESEHVVKPPVVLFLAGSGPTDRNGNNTSGLRTNAYRLLAEALQKSGVASVRFDKRGIAASAQAGIEESELRVEHYVDDALRWIDRLTQDDKYSKIIILGHSEGSLVGMIACTKTDKADGFISLCGAGSPIDEVLREQIGRQSPSVRNALFPILDELKQGTTVEKIPAELSSLVRPSLQPYLISWMKYNPQTEIKKLTIPVLIIQGGADIQISVADAEKLSEANPNAKKIIIKNMDHVLKQSNTTFSPLQQLSVYTNPNLPLHNDLTPHITKFIAEIK